MSWAKNERITGAGGIFDKELSSGYDLINIRNAEGLFNKLADRLVKDNYIQARDKIDFLLINNNRFVAFPAKEKDRYAICLSTGTLNAIWNLLILSLSDPAILPGYPGDAIINYDVTATITDALLFGPAIRHSFDFDPQHTKNKSNREQCITRERLELCETFFSWILDYLFYHEATHIIRDHISYLSIYSNDDFIDETKLFEGKKFRITQLFEIDADMHAMDYAITSNPEFTDIKNFTTREVKDFYFIELLGFIIVQQLFDLEHKTIADQLCINHPPPVFRAIIWTNSMLKTFRFYDMATEETVREEHDNAWSAGSLIALKLGLPEGRWHGENLNGVPFDTLNELLRQYSKFEAILDTDNVAESFSGFNKYIHAL